MDLFDPTSLRSIFQKWRLVIFDSDSIFKKKKFWSSMETTSEDLMEPKWISLLQLISIEHESAWQETNTWNQQISLMPVGHPNLYILLVH